eukprot:TRINITY_DN11843_c0_g1_i1.p1 TRINITY_DN11843_c0_g1~~TRINITY_DN11843_c0_g1_i1.p1  ORF type:complete len:466 (+),score=60.44 TRINITY_DN11843_c0_g1_i1:24-1400(+)
MSTESESIKEDTLKVNHKQLMVIFFSLLIDLLAFTLILPLFPTLLEYYGYTLRDPYYKICEDYLDSVLKVFAAPTSKSFHLVFFGGILGSLFSMLQFISTPFMCTLSDIYGRKPLMLFSLFGIGLAYLVWMFSYSFSLFVLSRILGGITKCNISIAISMVADLTPVTKRNKGMAVVGIAFSLGFIFGPIIGVLFSRMSTASDTSFTTFQYPAMFALVLTIINIIFLYFFLEESLPIHGRATSFGHGIKSAIYLSNPYSLLRFDAVVKYTKEELSSTRLLGGVYLSYMILFAGMEYALSFLVHDRLAFTRGDQGKMYFVVGLIMIVLQGGIVRRLKSGSEKLLGVSGIIALVPSAVCFAFLDTSYTLYIGIVMYSYASATVVTALTTLASLSGADSEKGKILGIMRAIGAFARGIGPFLVCSLYWSIGSFGCYLLAAVVLFVPLLLLISYHQPKVKKEE